jgi:hypothetical protein
MAFQVEGNQIRKVFIEFEPTPAGPIHVLYLVYGEGVVFSLKFAEWLGKEIQIKSVL